MISRRIDRLPWRRGWMCVVGLAALAGGETFGQAPAKKAESPRPAVAGQIPAEILRRVKRATVHMKVGLPNGQKAEGSGFFGVEPGIVLTNAHVLGMFKSDSRRPVSIMVVLNSGTRDERTVPAEVLGVDTNSDLAVLRVKGTNLPTPLEVGPADELLETQSVYVFGFPFGSSLGKAITVNTSSVSSLRRNKAGVLQRVQVNGGMNPGNSGGPVVDVEGKVIGVAVSVIQQTQINFAVPGEAVRAMLAGRVQEITMGHPYKKGNDAQSLFELKLLDPLHKIGKISVLIWSGASAKTRTEAPPPPPAGDPKRREAKDLTVKEGVASIDLTLPVVAPGEVYWVQPSFTDGAGQEQKWLPVLWPVKPPVDREPVVLQVRYKPNSSHELELTSNTTLTLRDSQGEEHTLTSILKAGIVETVKSVDSQGIASIHLKYSRITLGAKVDNQPLPRDKQSQAMIPNLFKVGADIKVDSKGAIIENKLDLGSVPRSPRDRGVDRLQDPEVAGSGRAVVAGHAHRGERGLDRPARPPDRDNRRRRTRRGRRPILLPRPSPARGDRRGARLDQGRRQGEQGERPEPRRPGAGSCLP